MTALAAHPLAVIGLVFLGCLVLGAGDRISAALWRGLRRLGGRR